MGVLQVIQLPAPVQRRPPTARLGLVSVQINPLSRSAALTLAAVDAGGNLVASGDTIALGASGPQYDAAWDALTAIVLEHVRTVLTAQGLIADGALVVDARRPT